MTWVKTNTIGNYEINENAEVRNAITHKAVKSFKHKSGYLYVTMCEKGKHHNYRLHRLVALSFIPNPDNLPTVNHKDLNKENNNVSNLEWMSTRDNNIHAQRNLVFRKPNIPPEVRKSRARNAYLAMAKKVDVLLDGMFVTTYESVSEASRKTGVCRKSVEDRLKGRYSAPVRGYEFRYAEE